MEQRSPSAYKSRIGGVLLIVIALALAYLSIVSPLRESAANGILRYSWKGVLLPVAFLYLGIGVMIGDLRDEKIRTVAADGSSRFTPRAKFFLTGLVVLLCATYAGWKWYLHSIGFVSQ